MEGMIEAKLQKKTSTKSPLSFLEERSIFQLLHQLQLRYGGMQKLLTELILLQNGSAFDEELKVRIFEIICRHVGCPIEHILCFPRKKRSEDVSLSIIIFCVVCSRNLGFSNKVIAAALSVVPRSIIRHIKDFDSLDPNHKQDKERLAKYDAVIKELTTKKII